MRRSSWLSGAATAAITSALATAVYAQTPPEAAPEDTASEVEAVIVTAQRREQSITDVPISISVIDDSLLQSRGAQELSEIQGVVPGVYFSGDTNYGTAPIAIRGTGGSGTTFGDEPVAVYVDDVYLGRSAGFAASELLDIEAVEIVRGPQGTLQGRNATAGAVILRTADPTRTFRAYARATAADPADYRLEGAVSGPITQHLSGRLALGVSDEEGWAENLANGGRLGSSEGFQARATFLLEPDDAFRIRVSVDASRSKINPATARFATTPPIPPAPAPFVPTPQVPLSRAALDLLEDNRFSINDPNTTEIVGGGVTAQVAWSGPLFDVISVSAYRESSIQGAQDSDSTGQRFGRNTGIFNFHQASQEVRLQSNGHGPLQWTAGVYLFDERQEMNPFIIYNFLAGPPNPLGAQGRAGTRAEFNSFQDTRSWAAFADGRYEFLPRTGFTAGVRYTYEEKDFTVSRAVFFDLTNTPLPFPTSTIVPKRTREWDDVSYRFVLDHELTSGALLYVKYSKGFKSGGFNAFGTEPAFEPETLTSLEVGAKGEFLNRRLFVSSAAYFNKYDDLQIRAGVPAGGVAVTNAASSEIKGFEVEGQYRSRTGLRLTGSIAYTDAVFTDFPLARNILDLPAQATGNRLPRAPELQYFVSAAQRFDLGVYEITAEASYRWRDEVFFYQTDQNLPTFRGDALGEVDARLQIAPQGANWQLAVFGRNLTNERVANSVTPLFSYPVASFNDPRTIGVQAEVRF
jgi:iron complex outermembrane receptor protein